jgi:hypothetical protein
MPPEIYGDPESPSAIVVRASERVDGISFFTPGSFSQQLGLMSRPSGYEVKPHFHNPVSRNITETQEVLLMRKGRCKVTLYKQDQAFSDFEVSEGDVVLLATSGHGIEMLTDSEILEIKQGPYAGEFDKTFIQL